jgi:hypothetical protein
MSDELEALKAKCLKKDGQPKKNASTEDLARLAVLQNTPVDPQTRITTEEKHGKVIIKVAPGSPMALYGKNDEDQWKVISVISSHGAAGIKVPVGKYSDYRLSNEGSEVNDLMTQAPPEVVMGPHSKKKHPKIMKENE